MKNRAAAELSGFPSPCRRTNRARPSPIVIRSLAAVVRAFLTIPDGELAIRHVAVGVEEAAVEARSRSFGSPQRIDQRTVAIDPDDWRRECLRRSDRPLVRPGWRSRNTWSCASTQIAAQAAGAPTDPKRLGPRHVDVVARRGVCARGADAQVCAPATAGRSSRAPIQNLRAPASERGHRTLLTSHSRGYGNAITSAQFSGGALNGVPARRSTAGCRCWRPEKPPLEARCKQHRLQLIRLTLKLRFFPASASVTPA